MPRRSKTIRADLYRPRRSSKPQSSSKARKGEAAGQELDLLLHKADVVVVPVDTDQISEARRAYRRFGKGRHEAGLNFGDLFSYALARTSGEPLLFKGDNFSRTDVRRVL